MAFGEKEHKKSPLEKLTMVVIVIMVLATVGTLILQAASIFW